MRRRLPIAVVLLLLMVGSTARAWSTAGHTVVGAIAYDILRKEHPLELAKLLALLRQHPTYDTVMKAKEQTQTPENRDRWLFMIAARWPDDTRYAKGGYSYPDWHYIDYPIIAKGETAQGKPPEGPNALTALAKQVNLLQANWAVPADKALAICWIEHLVGDLHQPLHCCSLYTAALPDGDRGGNLTFVCVGTRRTIALHAFWDELLGSSAKYQDNANTATELRLRPDLARDKLIELTKNTTPESWAKESLDLASKAYLGGTLKGGSKTEGIVLPEGYPKEAKAVAEKRAVLAGYWLADLLVAAVK